MKIEIDCEDLMTILMAAIVIVALFTVPGCVRDELKLQQLKEAQKEKP